MSARTDRQTLRAPSRPLAVIDPGRRSRHAHEVRPAQGPAPRLRPAAAGLRARRGRRASRRRAWSWSPGAEHDDPVAAVLPSGVERAVQAERLRQRRRRARRHGAAGRLRGRRHGPERRRAAGRRRAARRPAPPSRRLHRARHRHHRRARRPGPLRARHARRRRRRRAHRRGARRLARASSRSARSTSASTCSTPPSCAGSCRRSTADNAQGEYYLTELVHRFLEAGDRGGRLPHGRRRGQHGRQLARRARAGHRHHAGPHPRAPHARRRDDRRSRRRPTSTGASRSGATPSCAPQTHPARRHDRRRGLHGGPGLLSRPTSTVDDGATIVSSHLVGCLIGPGCSVGPFAHMRPEHRARRGRQGRQLRRDQGEQRGQGQQGAAPELRGRHHDRRRHATSAPARSPPTTTAQHKHPTAIGSDVKVGSDTVFVAPVTIGDGAYTGAGSTITNDVPEGALGVARGRQENVEGYAARRRAAARRGRLIGRPILHPDERRRPSPLVQSQGRTDVRQRKGSP